jgi:hypothetical protein
MQKQRSSKLTVTREGEITREDRISQAVIYFVLATDLFDNDHVARTGGCIS